MHNFSCVSFLQTTGDLICQSFFFYSNFTVEVGEVMALLHYFIQNSTTRLHKYYGVSFRLEVFPLCEILVIIYPLSFLCIPIFFFLPNLASPPVFLLRRSRKALSPRTSCSIVQRRRPHQREAKGQGEGPARRTKTPAPATLCARTCVFLS